jgi:hypothetical protein
MLVRERANEYVIECKRIPNIWRISMEGKVGNVLAKSEVMEPVEA